jgi:hypothetical protein
MVDSHQNDPKAASRSSIGLGVAIGAAIGAGIGAAIHNMGTGLAIGVALGVSFATYVDKQRHGHDHPRTG